MLRSKNITVNFSLEQLSSVDIGIRSSQFQFRLLTDDKDGGKSTELRTLKDLSRKRNDSRIKVFLQIWKRLPD